MKCPRCGRELLHILDLKIFCCTTCNYKVRDMKKQTIIDGVKVIVECCYNCPFYDEASDGWRNICRYPNKHADLEDCQYAALEPFPEDCPLVDEEDD